MKNIPEDQKGTKPEDRAEEKPIHWSMSSSDGRTRIQCTIKEWSEKEEFMTCQVEIQGKFWSRGDDSVRSSKMVDDFGIALNQVLIDMKDLSLLFEKLRFWQINMQGFDMEISTKKRKGQNFMISIGQEERLICSPAKPACKISYNSSSAMMGQWIFLVYQSCIKICADEIAIVLKSLAERRPQHRRVIAG